MKINQDYLKRLLEAFESAERPTLDLHTLEKAGLKDDEHVLVFHMQILNDSGFIQRGDGKPGFGLVNITGYEDYGWSVTPLRLTASGHQFIEALRNEEVWEKIKSEFKDASVGTLWEVSKKLLEAYAKKKVEVIIGI